ncbi:hypothetical protein HNR09_001421 [Nesterenkonia xinjiangensis]|uniref:Uncharacterized protein n=1 Tax=Nesterenkonia xinjiangensis TaxID=225327 RepID=A0A7Z0GLA4_9MICC|nr:hypothetical protein [Nesterenkonia xinjiangensis]
MGHWLGIQLIWGVQSLICCAVAIRRWTWSDILCRNLRNRLLRQAVILLFMRDRAMTFGAICLLGGDISLRFT